MRIKLLSGFLLLAAACTAYESGEVPLPPDGSMVIAEEISNLKVNGFAEDKDGHIWIATGRGLNKYTVNEYHQYFCADDTLGLPDNLINTVYSAKDGTLWVGTVNGVARRISTGGFSRVPVLNRNQNISFMAESKEGEMLFSNGNTLFRYDSDEGAIRPVIREFNSFGSPGCIIASDGRIWSISDGGTLLNCYSSSDFSLLQCFPLGHQTYHICDAGNGELWLSGMGRLSILDTRTGQWKELPAAIKADKRLMSGDIDLLFAPDDRSMLMNVIGKGFFYYSRSRGRVIFRDDAGFPYTIPDTEVRTVFRDNYGNLWFGTTDRGFSVSYHENGLFGSNKYLTGAFQGKNVTALCPDSKGGLWIATLRDGLYRYDLASGAILPVETSQLISDSGVGYIRVSNVFCDSEGELWLLFSDKMRAIRCHWNGRSLVPLKLIYSQNPTAIVEDDRGCIWIGGIGNSIQRYDRSDGSIIQVPVADEGDWTYVTCMVMSEPGKLRLGAFNKGPLEVNTYSMECRSVPVSEDDYTACIRRSVIIPTCIMKDSAGELWTGMLANGVIRQPVKGGFQPVDGTPCQDICAIEEDRQGNIWVSTMDGLARYDRTVGTFVHYFEADGIGGNQFNERASCMLPDGTMVFGGTHGLTWFNPLDTPAKHTVPLVFENLTIHNRLVMPQEKGPIDKLLSEKPDVTIKHNQNGFGISFAALDYSQYEQIRYAYKLEGFDRDWVRIGTRHDAYFANIPPGHYKLNVRITNASHSVTESVESLNIRVMPPWYLSWWAILLYVVIAGFLLAVGYTFWRHVRRIRKLAARRIREVRREREKAEESEKAEKALNKIQMNYFSNVAHEFRTPLTMIAGPAQQLAASEGIKGQDRQLVDIIKRNSIWMLSLVNQLLDFNRIGNSKLQMKVAKMDIVGPLKSTADLFRYNAKSKGIELNTHGLEDSFTMWADADKVQKVVMNLLSNALKFTPSGGRVTLGFDVITRDEAAAQFPLTEADTDSRYAFIRVSDSGPGIPEDQREKIFERFYQASGGMKLQGSGIGLFYARALTGLHHGYIKAWNAEDGGAVFGMILPVSASSYTEDERTDEKPQLQFTDVPQAEEAETPEKESSRKHIVVVDDDIDIANYLKIMLSPYYKVSLHFDGASALKSMEEEAPDLIISDVVMPGMSGYELCEHIKGDLQLSHIPVVLVTAKVAVESQVQGLDKGADAYVTKPFQPAYLLALIKSLLENREKLHRQLGSVTTTEEIAPEALSPRDAAFMKELYELMENELSNADLDIMRITEMMKISRTKFYYKVKGLTGENPSVFFKRYKLNRAATLLKEGKFNMSEIAWMTGFNTLSHFSTSFKKQFGVPPSEYGG